MADVTAKMVQELREKTGAGMMDCKKVLTEAGGDMAKAEELLKKKGLSSAAKKSSRAATEGVVTSYIHMGGKIGVLLEVNIETKTKDNVFVTVPVAVQSVIREENVEAAYYRLSDPEGQIRSYVFDVVRSALSGLNLDQSFEADDYIATTHRGHGHCPHLRPQT